MAPVLAGTLHIGYDKTLPLRSVGLGLAPQLRVDRKSMVVRRAVLGNQPEDCLKRSAPRLGMVQHL